MKYITHTPSSKDITIWFVVFAILVFIPVISGSYFGSENQLLILPIAILSFFIFNLAIRKLLVFKSYFTSRYNVLTTKFNQTISYSISRDLMFEKVIEVLNDSKFKLVKVDKDSYEILAVTNISWLSWGENLYIELEGNGDDESIMKFCSVTFFQVYAWGKNEKNYTDLLQAMEESFTV